MAAHRNHHERTLTWRNKIRGGVLINRLQRYASGDPTVEMTRGQVHAAQILLKKVLPDLNVTELGTKDGQPLRVSIVKFSDLPEDEKPDER